MLESWRGCGGLAAMPRGVTHGVIGVNAAVIGIRVTNPGN
jgi:hypothetical protein